MWNRKLRFHTFRTPTERLIETAATRFSLLQQSGHGWQQGAQRLAAMGDGVLFGRFHLRGRELLAGFDGTRRLIVGHEQRVVAEAMLAMSSCSSTPGISPVSTIPERSHNDHRRLRLLRFAAPPARPRNGNARYAWHPECRRSARGSSALLALSSPCLPARTCERMPGALPSRPQSDRNRRRLPGSPYVRPHHGP